MNSKWRTKNIGWNVLASFFIKGWSAFVVLIMVPLTLNCLGEYKNGVWLTVSSMLLWLDHLDIGLGNGLRNKLAIYIAHGYTQQARSVISSTMTMLVCIILPMVAALSIYVWYGDVFALLNVDSHIIPELRVTLQVAIILVCLTLVMKFVGNVYMGLQLPAISNLLISIGATLALAATWVLYHTNHATFFTIAVVNTAAPLVTYMIAYLYTFYIQYPQLKPSPSQVNMQSAIEMANVGIKFFWLQIAGIIQFMSANILLSQFFTPEIVTPYQIAYRYMSIAMVAFTVICMPFWNATTDAFEHNDMDWIRNASRKLNLLTFFIAIGLVIMIAVSPWVYQIWIGEANIVPFPMTIMMGIYIFFMILSMRYSYFLNGIGALRLQLLMTISAVVFIPLAWGISHFTHSVVAFMAVMCICNVPSIVINIIQFNKILKRKATGIWRI